jgi:hypothetical protein
MTKNKKLPGYRIRIAAQMQISEVPPVCKNNRSDPGNVFVVDQITNKEIMKMKEAAIE